MEAMSSFFICVRVVVVVTEQCREEEGGDEGSGRF